MSDFDQLQNKAYILCVKLNKTEILHDLGSFSVMELLGLISYLSRLEINYV